MTITVFGKAYDTTTAPRFARYALDLITNKYGTNLDTRAPRVVKHHAKFLCGKFGV